MTIWYSGAGYRWQYGRAGQATDVFLVKRRTAQVAKGGSGTGDMCYSGIAGQATDGNMAHAHCIILNT
jgi:hypothetical protein